MPNNECSVSVNVDAQVEIRMRGQDPRNGATASWHLTLTRAESVELARMIIRARPDVDWAPRASEGEGQSR